MKQTTKNINKTFIISFMFSLLLALIVYILKIKLKLPNIANSTSLLLYLTPIILFTAIIVPYTLYEKKVIKNITKYKWETFLKLHHKYDTIRIVSLLIAAIFVNATMLFIYKTEYWYLNGIILLFFLMYLPNLKALKKKFQQEQENKK